MEIASASTSCVASNIVVSLSSQYRACSLSLSSLSTKWKACKCACYISSYILTVITLQLNSSTYPLKDALTRLHFNKANARVQSLPHVALDWKTGQTMPINNVTHLPFRVFVATPTNTQYASTMIPEK